MSDNMTKVLAFFAGAAIGSIVAWKLVEKKYRQIADDEIASVKEVYEKRKKKEDNKETPPKDDIKMGEKYGSIVTNLGYAKESGEKKEEEENMVNPEKAKIYVIPPESFGECGYETESLTYYADNVLAFDTTNIVVKNVDDVVGRNSLKTFGEYEDDSVFVRNENLKKDFEILLDMRNYCDVVTIRPHYVTDDDD